MGKVSCGRSKTECKSCSDNDNGWCTFVDKSVDELYKQWISSRKSKMRRKLKDNADFFEEKTINKIIHYAEIIKNSEIQSREQIDAMGNLSAMFYNWKSIDTEILFE